MRPALRYVWPSRLAAIIPLPFLLALALLAGACDARDTPDGGAAVDAAGAPGPDASGGDDIGSATGAPGGSASRADSATDAPAGHPGAVRPGSPTSAAAEAPGRILFVGTSLTSGYGVGDDLAYPAVLQQKIDAAGLPYQVVNAGVSGETSAGGLRRIDWLLQNPVDVLVLELGANDGLRGLDVRAMRDNLDEIMTRARARHPEVMLVVLGMEAPPNLGRAYADAFRNVFAEIAAKHDAAFVPFLLEDVAAVPGLNQDDGIHPNVRGHRVLADNVWPVLREVLGAG